MKRLKIGIASLCIPFLVGAATAQVAPPPPGPKPAEPEYIPPPPPPTPQKVQRTTPQNPNQSRLRGNDPLKGESLRGKLPPLQWLSLAEVGEDGKIKRFKQPLDLVALKPNPAVAQSRMAEIMPVLAGRRYRMEQIVIENLDFALRVEDGLFENLDITKPEAMKEITDIVTPLVPPKSLSIELFDRGVLSRVQKDFNFAVMKDYQKAIQEELVREYGDKGLGEFMKFIMGESVKEAINALDGMLMESTWRMEEVLNHAGLSSVAGAADLLAIKGSAEDDEATREARIAQIKQIWKPWTLEQKQSFLRAVEETREDPYNPPIPAMDITPYGMEDATEKSKLKLRLRTGDG